MILRSPFPDVADPRRDARRVRLRARGTSGGTRPALIDGPSGRAVTYGELRTLIDGAARRSPRAASRAATCSACTVRTFRSMPRCSSRSRNSAGVNTTANPTYGAEELAKQLTDSGAKIVVTAPTARGESARRGGDGRGGGGGCVGDAPGCTSFASFIVGAASKPRCHRTRRPGARPRRTAVLERHDRASEGRDADASQPRGEPRADRVHRQHRVGRSSRRRAAVLPHLWNDRRAVRRAAKGRLCGDDAAVRSRAVFAAHVARMARSARISFRRSRSRSRRIRSSIGSICRG